MRANVFISSTGFCSRRAADKLIESGKVKVNGNIATIGMDISELDDVTINDQPLSLREEAVYLIYHKPKGIETTTDRTKKNNIIDAINYPIRIFPIGRLDKDSTGLILLTNDGGIVNKILRSEYNHDKEYIVTVDKLITSEFLDNMSNGVDIYNPVKHEIQKTKKAILIKQTNHVFRIILTQGLNLQIRRMCKVLGYRVLELHRIRVMNITIDNLKSNQYRKLTNDEVKELNSLL